MFHDFIEHFLFEKLFFLHFVLFSVCVAVCVLFLSPVSVLDPVLFPALVLFFLRVQNERSDKQVRSYVVVCVGASRGSKIRHACVMHCVLGTFLLWLS